MIQECGPEMGRAYESWCGMRMRCRDTDPKWRDGNYAGIQVCERWENFETFVKDMGLPPFGFTLDRMESMGDYAPNNCRWADAKTQSLHRGYVKLSIEKATTIRELYKFSKLSQQKLVKMFDVSQQTISLIVRQEYWI